MLKIKNLHVTCGDTEILRGIDLEVLPGEIHAIMGPNGSGKSTLGKVIAGHPDYEVTEGDIELEGTSLLEMEPAERAIAGLFLGFQYPIEVPGVTNFQLLHAAYNASREGKLEKEGFEHLLKEKAASIGIEPDFIYRDVNCGFSGGEKKRNEILQMLLLDPKCAILDETDSGLDIDAMRHVSDGINRFMRPEKGLVLITHYQRLLDYVKPDKIHVLIDGKIQCTGGSDLSAKLEAQGYDWLQGAPA